jgi:hypothetical protein
MDLTRRDFLKLCGVTAAGIFASRYINLLPNIEHGQKAEAQTNPWTITFSTPIPPIHIALLHTGKVLYGVGSGWNYNKQQGPFEARIRDMSNGAEKLLTQTEDLWCCGQTTLADGTILLAGGTLMYDTNPDNCNGVWHGLNAAYEFNPTTETFTKVQNMLHGRWYPTLVTMADGRVWCYNGLDEYGVNNRNVERYDPVSKTWTLIPATAALAYTVGLGSETTCPGEHPTYANSGPTTSYYPRAHFMPSGLIVMNGFRPEVRSWNPATGAWGSMGNTGVTRYYGTSFLLPLQNTTTEKGKILVCCGSDNITSAAKTSAQIIDFNAGNPLIRTVASSAFARLYLTPVILPDGKCVVFGGTQLGNSNPVLAPESFDPVTETWQTLPASTIPRYYHTTALLLPDGRVWVAGGTRVSSTFEPRTEFFSPSYMTQTRPTMSVPTVGAYGGSINIPTPNAADISSVSLVRLMNTTHHYDANQRLVWLQIASRGSSNITVSAPINANIAPPGYYMIHVLNSSGIPSAGSIIKIPGAASTPDTTIPNLAITSPATGSTLPPGSVLVQGTASDNTGGSGVRDVRVRVDTGAYVTATPQSPGNWSTWSITVSITAVGSHTITANCRDNAGNFRTRGSNITIA